MVRRGSGAWQQSDTYRRDQARVELLVERVGRAVLCFTAYDVARAARASTGLQLEESSQLSRHLRDVPAQLLMRVSSALVVRGGSGSEERVVRRYVLAERHREWLDAGGGLTDTEKVLVGLWIASAVFERFVPTIAVSRVLQLVPSLTVRSTALTNTVLSQLVHDGRAIRRAPDPDDAWVYWGVHDTLSLTHRALDDWMTIVRAAVDAEGSAVLSSAPSRNQVTQRLVTQVIAATRSHEWPTGRLVNAADIRQHAAANAQIRILLERVLHAGGGLGRALQEASRPRVQATGGIERVVIPGAARTILYDAPTMPGSAERLLIADLQRLSAQCSEDRLLHWDRERREARRCAVEGGPMGNVGVLRQYLVGMAWTQAWHTLTQTATQGATLGPGGKALLKEMRARLTAREKLRDVVADTATDAQRILQEHDIDPCTWVVDTRPPYLTGHQFVEFCPPGYFGDDIPATVISKAVTLTRWSNPLHTRRQDPNPDLAASVVVDRVEGLLHLAEAGVSAGLTWLQRGASLLGPFLRDARLIRPMMTDDQPTAQQVQALAALVLLGDSEAVAWAYATLERERSSAEMQRAALFALHILQRDTMVIPVPVRRATNPVIVSALRAVLDARRRGRWLLQR